MNNYRVTFCHDVKCDYWNKEKGLQAESNPNFYQLEMQYAPIVEEIKRVAKSLGIKYIWHFYEPYIEITWLSEEGAQSRELIKKIKRLLHRYKITDLKIKTPKDGTFAEWYADNPAESEFGARRYAICGDLVSLFNEYRGNITNGKGWQKQVGRTIHGLCNPLGINYVDEGKICFKRAVQCFLFRYFSYNRACWIYKNILRFK